MGCKDIVPLYTDADILFDSAVFKSTEENDLFFVTLPSSGVTYVLRKYCSDDSEGVLIFGGLDSVKTNYLLKESLSEKESEALLFEKSFFALVRQNIDNIPHQFRMFNSAAGVSVDEQNRMVYGYRHDSFSDVEFIDSECVDMLRSMLRLIYSSDLDTLMGMKARPEEEKGNGLVMLYPESSWRKIIFEDFEGQAELTFNLEEKDRQFLKDIQPHLKIKGLTFEIDYNIVKVVPEDNYPYREIVISVTDPQSHRKLFLDCAGIGEGIAMGILKALLTSVLNYKYPSKIQCVKNSVYIWLKSICREMNISLELVKELPATVALYKDLVENNTDLFPEEANITV